MIRDNRATIRNACFLVLQRGFHVLAACSSRSLALGTVGEYECLLMSIQEAANMAYRHHAPHHRPEAWSRDPGSTPNLASPLPAGPLSSCHEQRRQTA